MKSYIAIGTCLLMLVALCGCGAQSPEQAYNRIVTEASEGNWDKVYESFSAKAQGQLDMALKMMASFASAFSEEGDADAKRIESMPGKELFVAIMSNESGEEGPVLLGKVITTEINGDSATLRIDQDGEEQDIQMVKENGEWKLCFEAI